jgi:hypothetical protein
MSGDAMDDGAMDDGPTPPIRVWRGRLVRLATGLVVLGLAAVVVAGPRPARADTSGASGAPGTTVVDVPPPRTTLVCPGPLVLPKAGTAGSAYNPVPVAPVTRVDAITAPGPGSSGPSATTATLGPLGAATSTARLGPSAGQASAAIHGPSGPVVIQADPVGSEPARAAGVTSALVTAGDLRGLAAAGCQRPSADLWLVGGSTMISSSADLVIDNAGSTASDVSVELWGPSGKVELVGDQHVLVAPGAEQVVVLAGIAAEQRRIVVHLSAAGGNVTAHVQDSLLNGFTPEGTDLVVPGAAPATRQVVSGLVVGASTVSDADPAVLSVLAPGTTAATAQVTLLGADGVTALPGANSIELVPGQVTDVPLGGLPAGAYTAVIDAPVPVVAAAMIVRPGLPGVLDTSPTLERAWAASASGPGGVVAVPGGTDSTVVLSAVAAGVDPTVGSVSVVLRALGPTGAVIKEQPVDLAAGHTTQVVVASLGAGVTGIELVTPPATADNGAQVAWSLLATVTQADGTLVSVVVPTPDAQDVTQVPVRSASRLGLG